MLDTKTAKMVLEAVNTRDEVDNHPTFIINMEDARRMEEIKISTEGGYAIYGITKKSKTILVKFHYYPGGKVVVEPRYVPWDI